MYLRSRDTLEEDVVVPREWFFGFQSGSIRHAAIEEVLRRIPDADYAVLVDDPQSFEWFVPSYESLASTQPFAPGYQHPPDERQTVHVKVGTPKGMKPEAISTGGIPYPKMARVVYLSPRLEKSAFDIAVAVVAHEVAHIVLDHRLIAPVDLYATQEKEVYDKICEWGFEREARKHWAMCKRRDTLEEKRWRSLDEDSSSERLRRGSDRVLSSEVARKGDL